MTEGEVRISRRGAERIRSGHLWVYRSDVHRVQAQSGDTVRVIDEGNNFMGRAFFSSRSQITLRLLTREDVAINADFLRLRIQSAVEYRRKVVANTDSYRIVYGESDLLPSIVVDRYSDWMVLQTLSQGAERRKQEIVSLLVELFSPRGILERNDPRVRELEGLERVTSLLYGELPEKIVSTQNGIRFIHDLHAGQKTGGFLDQRENHLAAASYAVGEVLDCFTYQGGFGLTVARNSRQVEAIDLSGAALLVAKENQGLNDLRNITFREGNVFDALREYHGAGRPFDTVILDPPAFAKNRDSLTAAIRGYKEINLRAIQLLRPGGILITCSCSYHVSETLFLQTVAEAANDAHRTLQVIERRTQGRDHPVLLAMPETHYLKCLVCRVL